MIAIIMESGYEIQTWIAIGVLPTELRECHKLMVFCFVSYMKPKVVTGVLALHSVVNNWFLRHFVFQMKIS